MGKLVPVVLAVAGLVAGGGAGLFLRPHSELEAETAMAEPPAKVLTDYVKMNNQFVVPVVEKGRVAALVILSLNLEVTPGSSEAIYAREPKLRDAFLQVMFDHANTGGFQGVFTDGSNLILLRQALREAGQKIMGEVLQDVLISDIVRQDT